MTLFKFFHKIETEKTNKKNRKEITKKQKELPS